MAKARRAYFVGERRYTPSQFRRLSRARKVEGMVEWFQARFTDPAHETPYNGREGGFQYIHGGPYDADDEIQNEFSDIADFDAMEEAVGEVTSDGIFEWAPVRDGSEFSPLDEPFPDWDDEPPFDAGVAAGEVADGDGDWPPIIGVPVEERDLHSEVLSSLDRFEAKLDAYAAQRARRSHNHPPGLVDDDALSEEEIAASRRAVAEVREGLAKEPPDAPLIARAALFIADIGKKLWAAVKTVGNDVRGGIIGGIAYAYHEELAGAAIEAASAIGQYVGKLQGFW